MALIFHEGIPGSGKSFEAVSKHLIPALKKERRCFVRINGLNFEQLAALAGIAVERCRELLTPIDEEQILNIDTYAMPVGSLVIIDELQNFFPDNRAKLSAGVTKWLSEHRHSGLDVLFMGQDLKDCHKLWRRRVDQKVCFQKLDMLGSAKYRWRLFKATGPEVFKEVSKGTESYDPAIFGSYASFKEGAEAGQKYDDMRASIWSSPLFRRYLPLLLAVCAVGIWYMFHLFKGGGFESKLLKGATGASPVSAASPGGTGAGTVAPPEKKGRKDIIEDLSEKFRVRLSAVVRNKNNIVAVFEWYDEALHVRERMTLHTIAMLGWDVMVDADSRSATLKKGPLQYVATQFPLETFGNVSDERQRHIAGAQAERVALRDEQKLVPTASSGINLEDGYGLLGKHPH